MADCRDLLIVFARLPEVGAVKTRLARAVGAPGAAALYEAFLEDLVRRFSSSPWTVRYEIAPPGGGFAERFAIAPAACREQRGADLGERMHSAFRAAHAEGYERTVLIGSDAPGLDGDAVERAFASLGRADLVIAPALDGGYSLIGLRAPCDVFAGVPWSTPSVLQATLERAAVLGLRHELLEPIFDVDEPDDLERLARFLDAQPAADLPATRAALARLAGSTGSAG